LGQAALRGEQADPNAPGTNNPAAVLVSPPVVCAVLVFLRIGPDEYQVYSLEGGP
jgi:hypothetical protein